MFIYLWKLNCNHHATLCFPASANCTDGQIRLRGGTSMTEGRVEICYDKTWGTICDTRWDYRDAQVACRQLGFPSIGELPYIPHINICVCVCVCVWINLYIHTHIYIYILVHRGDLTWKLPLQGHGHTIMLILDMARVIYILIGLVALEENKPWSTALTVELESPHTTVAMMMMLVSGVSVSYTQSDIMNVGLLLTNFFVIHT